MRIINEWILWLCKGGMILIVPLMTIMVFVQVILRYGFHNSLSWVDELARYLLVWLTCLGSVYGAEKGMHVSLEMTLARLQGKRKAVIVFLVHTATLVFFMIGFWQGILYAKNGWIQRSASLNLNMAYVYASIPVAFGLMLIVQTNRFAIEFKQMLHGDRTQSEMEYPT